MRHVLSVAVVAALMLSIAPGILGAPGKECWTTSKEEAKLSANGQTYYVEVDQDPADIWIYEEANGVPGLQRQDGAVDDVKNCLGDVEPDQIAF